ncbi:MAG: hypothetical protein HQL24_09525 [Candidatus Omnitrophica bacterium]|nr:hypothetical protein [Candidatus Omnitrophota bacterium]
MKNLLLLDADIVIDLHKIGLWKAVVSRYKVHLPSTIIGEIKHYWKGNEQVAIDLVPEIKAGDVVEVSVDPIDQKKVYDLLESKKVEAIHDGEREALSFMYFHNDEEFRIALKDKAAIRAAVVLDIIDNSLSVETLLKEAGALRQKSELPYELTEKRFSTYKTEGAFLFLDAEKPRHKKK